MAVSGKTFLCLAIAFCIIQVIEARPRYDVNVLENVKFDLLRKTMSVERDFEKDIMNLNYKIKRDANKLSKKAVKEGSGECIESSRLSAEEQVEEQSMEMKECLEDVKGLIESGIEGDSALSAILKFRSEIKNKLSECKNTGKNSLKNIQKEFQTAGKDCLM